MIGGGENIGGSTFVRVPVNCSIWDVEYCLGYILTVLLKLVLIVKKMGSFLFFGCFVEQDIDFGPAVV